MGSVLKKIKGGAKKLAKNIRKPISKITKGIARGIAKVGKSVMRGISRITKKLGPIGMIGLSIAMPYALSALGGGATGGLIGRTMMGPHGQMMSTGWLNSSNVFLKSIGQVGNAIRTGYTQATGAISKTFSTITRSITEGFSSMGKGNNIFSRISNGAKELFKNARTYAQKFKPFTSPGGSVDVKGIYARGPASYGNEFMCHSMTNAQAHAALEAGTITGDQLVGQSWGKTGWLTKANPMDKAIAETINKTYETNIMSNFNGSARKAFFDYKKGFDASGHKYNYQDIHRVMKDNFTNETWLQSQGKTAGFDFNKSGDFTHHEATMRANPHTVSGQSIQDAHNTYNYTFNGDKTFKVNGKSTLSKKFKSAAKGAALDKLQESLLKKTDTVLPDIDYSLMGDMTQKTEGATTYGGTNMFGSSGGSLLEGVYDKDQQERILNYYRHMNIVGSH